jgi:hypothetical protein
LQVAEPSHDEIRRSQGRFPELLRSAEVEKITVAEVVIDEEENITVTFNRDTTPSAVYQAANELVDALKGELDSSYSYT